MPILEFTVEQDCAGERADRYVVQQLSAYPEYDFSRSYVQQLFDAPGISVNGKPCAKSRILNAGDVLSVPAEPPVEIKAVAQNIPLDIVYEDDCLIVLNKPKGMVVHPAPGNPDGTLVNALLYHCGDSLSGINGALRPGIVHRIDKDTSGLLVVAKNDVAHRSLSEQIGQHTVDRAYRAVVHGEILLPGEVEQPIGRSKTDRKKMCVTEQNSKYAKTLYEPVARYEGYTQIECRLLTGRTHQIRVHMAYIGHPVAGDTVYGPANTPKSLNGQCLHAYKLGFTHPISGKRLLFTAPLPEYFVSFIDTLRES